ncbi:Na antiporter 1 [Golovinomyces cichoracearum]|uniref:Na antiporter 1 n=1 Tax=Golovinomyces cichoracearum TaxID=62708 RepID=A0A420I6X2_9PEZI|nr:Na antiporter 1 [Golovinomyces cichoracearum]
MTWEHLSINKPHLVYVILGGFTSLFMLCSSFIKERLYIGEATVATLCGIMFGPHAANLIDPMSWGNTDQVTLEFSRIVLVVQCFAVGVELPKYYVEKHWRSVTFLLLPVMTCGWMVTSLIIWWMIPPLNWLDSLCVSACVTATDPVLASSVVGKGKFARRVPKHLRDLLSAESGSNDGMAFPFIYLALYLIEYRPNAGKVAFSWFILTILYECVFGCIYGFIIGYIGRHGIKFAERHELVDRESFLVFYFVLALFCAGSGSMIGVDDLLVGFSAGVGFSNDGWFRQKTEESHVSDVIDLLLNLAYFVYLGTIIPWEQFNNAEYGITPWRLVIIAIFVILFRRIPAMMILKPFIPDIKTWREALFAGHFGPIGVGAIFVAILAKAELETGSSTPSTTDGSGGSHHILAWIIWPITTFLVISSILVHGSSIAVFTLGKHINTLALTMSYTAANEDGPGWLNRLPKITSTSRSQAKSMTSETDESEQKMEELPPGMLPPIGIPREFLRRQKEDDIQPNYVNQVPPRSRHEKKNKIRADIVGPGGPISQSAIFPQRAEEVIKDKDLPGTIINRDEPSKNELVWLDSHEVSSAGSLNANIDNSKSNAEDIGDIIKNQIAEVPETEVRDTQTSSKIKTNQLALQKIHLQDHNSDSNVSNKGYSKKLGVGRQKDVTALEASSNLKPMLSQRRRGPALAYQFGNTLILEDEDGEVLKTYELPSTRPKQFTGEQATASQGVNKVGNWMNAKSTGSESKSENFARQGKSRWGLGKKKPNERSAEDIEEEDDDKLIRFTIRGKGARLTKEELIRELQSLDPKTRSNVIRESELSKKKSEPAEKETSSIFQERDVGSSALGFKVKDLDKIASKSGQEIKYTEDAGRDGDTIYVQRNNLIKKIISDDTTEIDAERNSGGRSMKETENLSHDDEAELYLKSELEPKIPNDVKPEQKSNEEKKAETKYDEETAAEKRRRELALGLGQLSPDNYDSDDDNTPRVPPPVASRPGIRFAANPERPNL